MRTITQSTFGGPPVLEVVEVDVPRPEYGQVLVEIGAAGVNPVDLAVRSGAYPLLGEPPFTLGWDVAGVVREVGLGVSAFAPGDEVMGLVAFPAAGNAYGDFVLASPNELVHKPPLLAMEQAGGLPLAGLTAWQALVGIARIEEGQRVLIHRAAGGVDHLAVQIAKARGAHVIGTARAVKHELLRELGADTLVDYTTSDFVAGAGPVDVVLDLLGGNDAERSADTLVPGGLLIGAIGTNLGFTAKRAVERGVRFEVVSVRPSSADLAQLAALFESGRLSVVIDEALPLAEVAKAHELAAAGHTTGKLVLVP